jgi:hypothetical protein
MGSVEYAPIKRQKVYAFWFRRSGAQVSQYGQSDAHIPFYHRKLTGINEDSYIFMPVHWL